MKTVPLIACALVGAAILALPSAVRAQQLAPQLGKASLKDVLAALTLEEKVNLKIGQAAGRSISHHSNSVKLTYYVKPRFYGRNEAFCS
jgi:hypothetical protein